MTGVVHASNSEVIRQREHLANWLSDRIQREPQMWGVWPDAGQRWQFASRLLELRSRIRSCRITEAAEVAAL